MVTAEDIRRALDAHARAILSDGDTEDTWGTVCFLVGRSTDDILRAAGVDPMRRQGYR